MIDNRGLITDRGRHREDRPNATPQQHQKQQQRRDAATCNDAPRLASLARCTVESLQQGTTLHNRRESAAYSRSITTIARRSLATHPTRSTPKKRHAGRRMQQCSNGSRYSSNNAAAGTPDATRHSAASTPQSRYMLHLSSRDQCSHVLAIWRYAPTTQ
jgi:hypothetical protein